MAEKQVVYLRTNLEILLAIFVVLKLTHLISWSWWWVLSPFWIPLAFVVFLILPFLFVSYLILRKK